MCHPFVCRPPCTKFSFRRLGSQMESMVRLNKYAHLETPTGILTQPSWHFPPFPTTSPTWPRPPIPPPPHGKGEFF